MMITRLVLRLSMVVTVSVACDEQSSAPTEQPSEIAKEVLVREGAADALEAAARAFDRGEDAASIMKELSRLLADDSASQEVHDDARILLSRVREKTGDREGAIAIVEELLAGHANEGAFPQRKEAESRLRSLLIGNPKAPAPLDLQGNYAPVADVLAPFFVPDEAGYALVDVAVIGTPWNEATSPVLGIRKSIRQLREAACPLCEVSLNLSRSVSHSDSWVDVPRLAGETAPDMPNVDRSLVVMLYDLDRNHVPPRYDRYLALPSAELDKLLKQGDGVIALRKRGDKRPLIVLAAPRTGQLSKVQAAFESLTELGEHPVRVPLAKKLTADEVQLVVRGHMQSVRSCYKDLLRKNKDAEGKLSLNFKVLADGSVASVQIPKEGSLDGSLVACTEKLVRSWTFPVAGEATNVTYPLVFAPTE